MLAGSSASLSLRWRLGAKLQEKLRGLLGALGDEALDFLGR
jgi:hypothetical protein